MVSTSAMASRSVSARASSWGAEVEETSSSATAETELTRSGELRRLVQCRELLWGVARILRSSRFPAGDRARDCRDRSHHAPRDNADTSCALLRRRARDCRARTQERAREQSPQTKSRKRW